MFRNLKIASALTAVALVVAAAPASAQVYGPRPMMGPPFNGGYRPPMRPPFGGGYRPPMGPGFNGGFYPRPAAGPGGFGPRPVYGPPPMLPPVYPARPYPAPTYPAPTTNTNGGGGGGGGIQLPTLDQDLQILGTACALFC